MRWGTFLAVVAGVALVCWPRSLVAQERGRGNRERAPGPRRGQLSPEEMAKRTERMKKALEQRVASMTNAAENLQARRDELADLTAKATIPVEPPSQQLFSAQGASGGRARAMRMAYRRRGEPARRGAPPGEPRPPRPGTLEVTNTEELKKAITGALDAYAALLPLVEEQKKAVQTQAGQLAAGARPDPARAREEMAAARELTSKVADAETAVGNAEADLDMLLAKAWLDAATQKATSEEARQAAAAAQEALTRYLALKPQLRELEEKIDQELSTAQDGCRKILTELFRQRAPRRPDRPRRREEL